MAVEDPTKPSTVARSRPAAPRPTKPRPPVDLDHSRRGLRRWLQDSLSPRPYVSLGRSGVAHWPLVAAVVVVCAVLAGAAATARTPNYTAEARLVAGRNIDPANNYAVAGLPAAVQQFASDYSRLVSNGGIDGGTAKLLGRSSLGGTLSASPIPQSPIIRLIATAKSPADAVTIANAGARELVAKVDSINASLTSTNNAIFKQYRDADLQLGSDQNHLNDLKNQLQAAGANAGPALKDQVLAAQTAVDADTVKVQSLANAYQQTFNPVHIIASNVQRVGSATATGSDKTRTLEIYVLAAIVIGMFIGIGIAATIDRRAGQPVRR